MEFIKDLYCGNIRPVERRFLQGTQYAKSLQVLCENERKLSPNLHEEQLKLFNEILDLEEKINSITEEENFKIGFRLGVHMMWDIFNEDESVFRKI